jgi:hypothetical protein
MSDPFAAEAALGRSAVATAMADPLTVALKKSLLEFMGISSEWLASGNRQTN